MLKKRPRKKSRSLKWCIHYAPWAKSSRWRRNHDSTKKKRKKCRYDAVPRAVKNKRQKRDKQKKNSDNNIKKLMNMFALFAKEESSNSGSSSESESLVGRKRDSKELLSTCDSLGSGSSGHSLDPLVVNVNTNKSSNDSMCKELHEYLKNNLFVYNEWSCPVRLRKYIWDQ